MKAESIRYPPWSHVLVIGGAAHANVHLGRAMWCHVGVRSRFPNHDLVITYAASWIKIFYFTLDRLRLIMNISKYLHVAAFTLILV